MPTSGPCEAQRRLLCHSYLTPSWPSLELTAGCEPTTKRAARRLGGLPRQRQAWLSRTFLLTNISERKLSVTTYLKGEAAVDARCRPDAPTTPDGMGASLLPGRKEKAPKGQAQDVGESTSPSAPSSTCRPRPYCRGSSPLAPSTSYLARYVSGGQVDFNGLVPHTTTSSSSRQAIRQAGPTPPVPPAIRAFCPLESHLRRSPPDAVT